MSVQRTRQVPFIVAITLAVSVGATLAATVGRTPATAPAHTTHGSTSAQVLQAHPAEHRIPTIDGATNPSAIDDGVARMLFLRMAAHPDPVASEAYIRYMFADSTLIPGEQMKQLRAIVARDADRLKTVDRTLTAGPDAASRKTERQKIADDFRLEFGAALGTDGLARFDKVIDQRVKSKLRVFVRP